MPTLWTISNRCGNKVGPVGWVPTDGDAPAPLLDGTHGPLAHICVQAGAQQLAASGHLVQQQLHGGGGRQGPGWGAATSWQRGGGRQAAAPTAADCAGGSGGRPQLQATSGTPSLSPASRSWVAGRLWQWLEARTGRGAEAAGAGTLHRNCRDRVDR